MLFPTFVFGAFFVIVFVVNWLTRPHPALWKPLMLTASIVFYGWWSWRFVFLLLATIVINWVVGHFAAAALRESSPAAAALRASEQGATNSDHRRRWWIRAGVAANLGILGVFKYWDFFAVEMSNLLDSLGISGALPVLEYTLPVGISFYTFQAMSYIIDIGRGRVREMAPLDFAVYLSFFPQLVAGPIVRAAEMAPQLAARPDPRYVPAAEAFGLILNGLFKKVVISSFLASEIVDGVFADPSAHSGLEVVLAVYAYAVQIYADFSGYTDIAIGVALLLGFRFPQNFDNPYRAVSLQDFWRRWHMTLSRWLRDYLYVPLGGNRRGRANTYRNLMIVMLLGGLWHGSTWNFVIWGGIHGVVLAVERLLREHRERTGMSPLLPSGIGETVRWLVTFHVVCLAWVFFRSESLSAAMEMLGAVANFGNYAGTATPLVIAVTFGALAFQFMPSDWFEQLRDGFASLGWVSQGAVVGLSLVAIDVLGPTGVAPFIYFQF
ncbi:MBOAT family O-acyltransferase [Candidatus Poriferisodalis sp.]|uniref:MBOAT family O-acyltransferase n=1 Tax=Candidatus Poriferisodalis sp. TaxID=3101277 RepID=UPI003B029980